MGSVFYVMMIMGCGDGGSACTIVQAEPVRYASAAQCQAAMPAVLSRADVDYPEVQAACRANAPELVEAKRAVRRG